MKGDLASEVYGSRAVRDAARKSFDSRVAQIRGELEERGVGGRIVDSLQEEMRETFDEVVEVAGQSKGIIAATIAALAIWYLRSPIGAALANLIGCGEDDDQDGDMDRE